MSETLTWSCGRELQQGGAQRPGRQRGERVGQRLDHHRVGERDAEHQRADQPRGTRPPPARQPVQQPVRQRQHRQRQRQADAEPAQLVDRPGAPVLGGDAVAAQHPLAPDAERQLQQADEKQQHQPAEDHAPEPAAAQRSGHSRNQPGTPRGEAEQQRHQHRDRVGQVGRRVDGRAEGVQPVQLGRGEVGLDGVDDPTARHRAGQGRPRRGDDDDHQERAEEHRHRRQRGPSGCGHLSDTAT